MHLHRTVAPGVAALFALSLLAAGCQKSPAESTPTKAPSVPSAAVSAATPAGGGDETPATSATTPATSGTKPVAAGTQAAIGDGRWPAYVTAVSEGTLTMDLVEFLTGDKAAKEWKKRYPGESDETPPNDYFIVNDNKKTRTLPLASKVPVLVTDGDATADTEVGVAGLKKRLEHTLYWLTVKGGKVVKVQEQFLP
ncbi:hypothetical protein COUCH_25195 [Couchioplanes caeruleus]|uniref:hypothetical protein n=1 Tax=Couchioplanes caeruleus TaxID=56438 RepID=UPI0020C0E070|nr:hypothetical protein [Couchioplanes caeruleus]UQU62321.1 hypothetical protein COUCH_25195 [Couchioplanes caeruleus]